MTTLFGGNSNLIVNATGTLVPQEFTPVDSQTVFNITLFTYVPNTNSLLVFINGTKQKLTTDFTETSSTSFTLTSAVTALDIVSIIGFPLSTITQLNGSVVGNLSATGTLAVGQAPNYSDTGEIATFSNTVAGYSQIVYQNQSAAVNASTNVNVSNNAGTATTNFGEFGINSSTFTGSGSFNLPGAVYLAAGSTDLVIGTYSAKPIHFVYNSSTTDAAYIDATGFNVPTQVPGTNTTQAASTAFVVAATSGTFVALTGNQTIAGIKTYTQQPVLPQAPALSAPIAAPAATSILFTGIPSWATYVAIEMVNLSTNGTSELLFKLGSSGGVESTGYAGASSSIAAASAGSANYTTGFGAYNSGSAAIAVHGIFEFFLIQAATNYWVCRGSFADSASAFQVFTNGSKNLAAALDRIQVTTFSGTPNFDAGLLAIRWS